MRDFIFQDYGFDHSSSSAWFRYRFDDEYSFEERVEFGSTIEYDYDDNLLDAALFLSFMLVGVSYYKLYPYTNAVLEKSGLDKWRADFFQKVYREGLSQYIYENRLDTGKMIRFSPTATEHEHIAKRYEGKGVIVLQSGGKDSLLSSALLNERGVRASSWYLANSHTHPAIIDQIDNPLRVIRRRLDIDGIRHAMENGGRNGHVPVTFIVTSFAIIDAILHGERSVLLSIGHEGEEPHLTYNGLPVNHQWSKSWEAEQLLSKYVTNYISSDIRVGSLLRSWSELKIAEQFAERVWPTYGKSFSSCNVANYRLDNNNSNLSWCGKCPKCANSYLLFAPFIDHSELIEIFGGDDLYTKDSLLQTFRGLLGLDGVAKPFECVGEVDELRMAYHMSHQNPGYSSLPFEVPSPSFDYEKLYEMQNDLI